MLGNTNLWILSQQYQFFETEMSMVELNEDYQSEQDQLKLARQCYEQLLEFTNEFLSQHNQPQIQPIQATKTQEYLQQMQFLSGILFRQSQLNKGLNYRSIEEEMEEVEEQDLLSNKVESVNIQKCKFILQQSHQDEMFKSFTQMNQLSKSESFSQITICQVDLLIAQFSKPVQPNDQESQQQSISYENSLNSELLQQQAQLSNDLQATNPSGTTQ